MANIINAGYHGELIPVNPNRESILGLKCYSSLLDIDKQVDLALITTPANTVSKIIDDCIVKNIPNAVIITSNFSETGEDGARLEREIVSKARAAGMRLVGPNTMGIYSSSVSLSALMPPIKPLPGGVSMISQSGNVGTQIMSQCFEKGIGFSKFVSSGNEGDLCCEDYLSYFGKDNETKLIVLYIESLNDGRNFIEIEKEIMPSKPVIVFKGGKTSAGMLAAASHTGAIAGSFDVYQSAFRQSGIIEATTTEEILDLIGGFMSFPLPRGNRVGILTRGGGWGVITTDACEACGLEVPPLSREILNRLDKRLPDYWSRGNPIDTVADMSEDSFLECLDALVSWDEVDAVISLGGSSGNKLFENLMNERILKYLGTSKEEINSLADQMLKGWNKVNEITANLMRKHNKPIINAGIRSDEQTREIMMNCGYITYPTPERAVRVLRKMYEYYSIRTKMS